MQAYEGYFCRSCFEKQQIIDKLEDENARLKAKLKYEENKTKEGYFGKSTPSSKKPFKANCNCGNEKKNGGAKIGHKGHGRRKFLEADLDEIKKIELEEDLCPHCKSKLERKGYKCRPVIETEVKRVKKMIYRYESGYCPKCDKRIKAKVDILPKFLVGNQLLAQVLNMHYLHGITVGKIKKMLGEKAAGINWFAIFHKTGQIFKGVMPKLINEYRKEKVRHADETGWRTDGYNGYCWLFCNKNISIFQFKDNRSGKVVRDILGTKRLDGYLVVDRYSGYNRAPCKIQYCYSHLERDTAKVEEEFSDNKEVKNFTESLIPLIIEAMQIRKQDDHYYKNAKRLKQEISEIINSPAQHLGIKNIQNIFKKNKNRMYHWAKDRDVPADNNFAEQELRQVVIARKVSFGSQSEKGAETRSILMSLLHTVNKRLKNKSISTEDWLKDTLDKIAINPDINIYSLIPEIDSG